MLIACGPTKFPIDCSRLSSFLVCAARAWEPLVLVIQAYFTCDARVIRVCFTCDSRVIHEFSWSLWCWHPLLISAYPDAQNISISIAFGFFICLVCVHAGVSPNVIQCDSHVIQVYGCAHVLLTLLYYRPRVCVRTCCSLYCTTYPGFVCTRATHFTVLHTQGLCAHVLLTLLYYIPRVCVHTCCSLYYTTYPGLLCTGPCGGLCIRTAH